MECEHGLLSPTTCAREEMTGQSNGGQKKLNCAPVGLKGKKFFNPSIFKQHFQGKRTLFESASRNHVTRFDIDSLDVNDKFRCESCAALLGETLKRSDFAKRFSSTPTLAIIASAWRIVNQ
ncbi:hypothetical protein M514_07307 [Trichuris suis]|uniref:Uncharacterized protein n=1 Tax=Trichuris suis TaxID=68888 RepID=A0A085M3I4_9BILA|nr:hypothetical protein M513_07307 [Trichuris suis]KFD64192.1 hypothetical protein M514_07307 [Trichuris suis]